MKETLPERLRSHAGDFEEDGYTDTMAVADIRHAADEIERLICLQKQEADVYRRSVEEIERLKREVRTQYECIIEYGRETERLKRERVRGP